MGRLPVTTYERPEGGEGGSKLPRNHHARAYRLSAGDHVLAAIAVQYRRMRGRLEIRDLLWSDETENPETVIAEVLRFALTDAYRCSGVCSLQLAGRRDNAWMHRVDEIWRMAAEFDVDLGDRRDGVIGRASGRELFIALSGLSPAAQHWVETLERRNRLRAETLCFLIASGIWSEQEAETMLGASRYPDLVFDGGAPPEDRVLSRLVFDDARAVILGGLLDRFIAERWETGNERTRWRPDQRLRVRVSPIAGSPSRSYLLDDDTDLSAWSRTPAPARFAANEHLLAIVLAREFGELECGWRRLLERARELRKQQGEPINTALVIPADVAQMSERERAALLSEAESEGLHVLAAPLSHAQLTLEARSRLSFSRTVRR